MQPDSFHRRHRHLRVQSFLGTASILFGAALVCLAFVAEMEGRLPFFMPRSWHVNRPLWYFLAIAAVAVGSYLLKSRSIHRSAWESSRPGVRFRHVVLYTRGGCHLCDDAKQMLRDYENYLPAVHEVDVDTDRRLIQRFGTCVPVIEIDGKVRFRGRLDETLLRRLIEGTQPQVRNPKSEARNPKQT